MLIPLAWLTKGHTLQARRPMDFALQLVPLAEIRFELPVEKNPDLNSVGSDAPNFLSC